jgi:hypothetical protein
MTSPLEKLSGPGKALTEEPSDELELEGLRRSGLVRLADAANRSVSLPRHPGGRASLRESEAKRG